MRKHHFLVTGCAGFIGGHTVDALLALGHEVTGIDNLSTGSLDNLRRSLGSIRFIKGDLQDAELAARAVDGVGRVIHLASVPSVPRSLDAPLESAHNSILATVALLDAARKAGVERVVQAASSSAYGETPTLPKTEAMNPSPLSPYAAAKLAQEYYGSVFARCFGIDTIALRYFNVFGPRQNPDSPYAAVIPKFIARMRAGERPQIYGDGEQTRDFTYIDNVVDANIAAALWPDRFGGAVANIGGGRAFSLNELVAELNRILGTDLRPEHLPPRPGDIRHSLADIGKAERLFGYAPKIGFAEGVARTVAWFGTCRCFESKSS